MFRQFIFGALAAFACAHVQAADGPLARLSWLAGCWQSAGGEAGSEEHWLPAAGGTMFGIGRTVKQGRTVAHEFMQIREGDAGALVFHANPSGKTPDSFALLRLADDEVVFQNPREEFPQRVAYKMEGPGKVTGRIEGLRAGSLRVIEFPLVRKACDAARP